MLQPNLFGCCSYLQENAVGRCHGENLLLFPLINAGHCGWWCIFFDSLTLAMVFPEFKKLQEKIPLTDHKIVTLTFFGWCFSLGKCFDAPPRPGYSMGRCRVFCCSDDGYIRAVMSRLSKQEIGEPDSNSS